MEARFWSKVKRGADDECWEWLASKGSHGYGAFYSGEKPGDMIPAHRIAWELTHGKIQEGLVVRHRCRGKCVNPVHMELGTQAENLADKVRDGTDNRGEKNPVVKLTEAQVRVIKQRLRQYERGMVSALAREFGVSHPTISDIKSGRNWSWI